MATGQPFPLTESHLYYPHSTLDTLTCHALSHSALICYTLSRSPRPRRPAAVRIGGWYALACPPSPPDQQPLPQLTSQQRYIDYHCPHGHRTLRTTNGVFRGTSQTAPHDYPPRPKSSTPLLMPRSPRCRWTRMPCGTRCSPHLLAMTAHRMSCSMPAGITQEDVLRALMSGWVTTEDEVAVELCGHSWPVQ